MKSVRSILTCPLFLLLFLAACAPSTPSALRSDSAQDAPTPTPQPTATALPTATLIPTATATATATATPLPTATATATATATSTPLPPAEIINGKLILRNPDGKTETLDVPAGAVLASPDGYSIKVEGKIFDRSVVKTAKQGEVKVWNEKGNPANQILAETPRPLTAADVPALSAGVPFDMEKGFGGNTGIIFRVGFWVSNGIKDATEIFPIIPGVDDFKFVTDSTGKPFITTAWANNQGARSPNNSIIVPILLGKNGGPFIHVNEEGNVISLAKGQELIQREPFLSSGYTLLFFANQAEKGLVVGVQFNIMSATREDSGFWDRRKNRGDMKWRDLQ